MTVPVKMIGHTLMLSQEFSIEIPDKEADAIHSGMFDKSRKQEGACADYLQ